MLITIDDIVYGQNKTGIVTDKSKPLSGAKISNLNSRKYATTGNVGEFIIALNKGDTLITSYAGFKIDTLIYGSQTSLLIALKPLTKQLNEVVIKGTRTTPLENLKKNQEDYKQIYRIGDDKGWLMLGIGFAINIDKLYSLLSREGKNARKLQKTLLNDYYADIVDSRFSKSLVTKYTGYHGQQLDNFMIDNRPTYDFIRHASDYDIIKYIQSFNKNAAPADSTIVTKKSK